MLLELGFTKEAQRRNKRRRKVRPAKKEGPVVNKTPEPIAAEVDSTANASWKADSTAWAKEDSTLKAIETQQAKLDSSQHGGFWSWIRNRGGF